MSFVTQDDVFAAIEPVLEGVFKNSAATKKRRRRLSASPTRTLC